MAHPETVLIPNLRVWRDAQHLTQDEAAAFFGITQAHWSRIENGVGGARPGLARWISRVTGVPFEQLLNFCDVDDSSAVAVVRQKRRAK